MDRSEKGASPPQEKVAEEGLIAEEEGEALKGWLARIELVHPRSMDLGLDRVTAVARRLDVLRPAPKVVTIAGTNGKGSTLRLLEAALLHAGHGVGATLSPHLHRFNERIRLHGEPATDEQIVAAFEEIEAARKEISLTYFEFGALAAMLLIKRAEVEVAILEVGLGGRLDAMNLVSADIGVITSIGIDHVDYLGPDRASIGREKAGILRPQQVAICGDPDPPQSLLDRSDELQARLRRRDLDFGASPSIDGRWRIWLDSPDSERSLVIDRPRLSVDNLATAAAIIGWGFPDLELKTLAFAMADVGLPGRMERFCFNGTEVWLDVAHNADGAAFLAAELRKRSVGKLRCLFGVLQGKDSMAMMAELDPMVCAWYLTATKGERGLSAEVLAERRPPVQGTVAGIGELPQLFAQAIKEAQPGEAVLACGSFDLIARARKFLSLAAREGL